MHALRHSPALFAMLLLGPHRFNLTLGERLIEHLKNWLDPDTLLQAGPFQWKSGACCLLTDSVCLLSGLQHITQQLLCGVHQVHAAPQARRQQGAFVGPTESSYVLASVVAAKLCARGIPGQPGLCMLCRCACLLGLNAAWNCARQMCCLLQHARWACADATEMA